MNSVIRNLAAAAALYVVTAGAAMANIITFGTAPLGDFVGPVTEAGFTYSVVLGHTYVNSFGFAGHDMEGRIISDGGADGGSIDIQRTGGGTFTFDSVDYAAFSSLNTGSQTLVIAGYRHGVGLGLETFSLANTSVYSPSYANWTKENASALSGLVLDDMLIVLNSFDNSDFSTDQAIDNVILTPTASSSVPEPGTLALLGAGAALLAGLGRRRKAGAKA